MKTVERAFTTISGVPVEPLYGPEDAPAGIYAPPGEFPYTRGIHRDMYRGKLWTMRQFSGFATPEETNRRYHYLLAQGQTGLSVAFDLPTLMGYDADHAMSEGEVGKCGASISLAGRYGDSLPRHSLGRRHGFDDHQLAGSRAVGDVSGGGGAAGRGLDAALGDVAERHPERVHRAEGIYFPAAALHAAGHRYHRVRRAPHAPLQSDLDQRLPYPRGRIHGRAGTGVHAARWHRVCGLGAGARLADRRVRSAPELLLQRPQRLLRGDRQVSRRPQDLGPTPCATDTARRASAA